MIPGLNPNSECGILAITFVCCYAGRIMDHQNSLQFPSDVGMSQDAKKLISGFLESG